MEDQEIILIHHPESLLSRVRGLIFNYIIKIFFYKRLPRRSTKRKVELSQWRIEQLRSSRKNTNLMTRHPAEATPSKEGNESIPH